MSSDLELAERAARAAGDVLMSYFGRAVQGLASKSSPTDPVSDADREAERTIREILSSARPADGLVGEEGSRIEGVAPDRRWIVDPLDGTVNFLYGLRAWAVSIALEDAEGLAVGVVFNPVDGECFSGERGEGAALNGRPIHVTQCTSLDRAMVATGFSYEAGRRAEQAEVLSRLLPQIRDVRRAGAAALDLAYVAAGRVDAFYERGLKPWDEAAGRLLVNEAGGVTEDLPGEPHGLAAAATPELLEELRQLMI
ncbi:MAG: monophosphatase [Thermoleophilaceae bacterium]|nr:monophosphatase [Thermoleophilaceae bacterium]